MSFAKAVWTFQNLNIAQKLVTKSKYLWNKKGQRINMLTSAQKSISIVHRESQNTTLVISKLHCKFATLKILHNYTLYNSQISLVLLSLTIQYPKKSVQTHGSPTVLLKSSRHELLEWRNPERLFVLVYSGYYPCSKQLRSMEISPKFQILQWFQSNSWKKRMTW